MRDWICIKCGATASSKCPSSRSIFAGPQQSIIDSLMNISTVHIDENAVEVLISVTAYTESNPLEQVLTFLQENKDVLTKNACCHVWVMNSETERTCVLDHEHWNLSDKERLLEEFSAPGLTTKPSAEQVHEDFAAVVRYVVGLTKQSMVRAAYPDRDIQIFYNGQLDSLRSKISELYGKIKPGSFWQAPFRLYYGYRITPIVFEDIAQAEQAYTDALRRGESCVLEAFSPKDEGYREMCIVPDLRELCHYCNKQINIDDKLVRTSEGLGHAKCHSKFIHQDDVVERWINIPITAKEVLEIDERNSRTQRLINERLEQLNVWENAFEVLDFFAYTHSFTKAAKEFRPRRNPCIRVKLKGTNRNLEDLRSKLK